MKKILHLKASDKTHEACHLYHTLHRDLIHATRVSGMSQDVIISDRLSYDTRISSVSFVNPVQYYLNILSQHDMDNTNEEKEEEEKRKKN
jgi:hypothetical protein